MSRHPTTTPAWPAVGLWLGFHTLSWGMVCALVWLGWPHRATEGHYGWLLTLVSWTLAFCIVRAVRPRRQRLTPPGLAVIEADQPELFAEIRRLASSTGQAMPKDVYVTPDVNAFVGERRGPFGLGKRHLLGVGMPLMQLLDRGELRAVLGHEFGHFAAGDTRLGPWIHRTRTALAQTLASLEGTTLLRWPFRWYGALFQRVTLQLSRQQEFAADALAARLVGNQTKARALRKVYGMAAGYEPYLHDEVLPILQAGMRPPFAAGWVAFLENNASAVQESLQAALEARPAPDDTHPPLCDRLEALVGRREGGAEASSDASDDSDALPAITLLRDTDELERHLLAILTGAPEVASFELTDWGDAARSIFPDRWLRHLNRFGEGLRNRSFADVPTMTDELANYGATWAEGSVDESEWESFASWTLGAAMAHELHRRGWEVTTAPGLPVRLEREGAAFEPFAFVADLQTGERSHDDARAELDALGLAAVPLRAPATPPATSRPRAVDIAGVTF